MFVVGGVIAGFVVLGALVVIAIVWATANNEHTSHGDEPPVGSEIYLHSGEGMVMVEREKASIVQVFQTQANGGNSSAVTRDQLGRAEAYMVYEYTRAKILEYDSLGPINGIRGRVVHVAILSGPSKGERAWVTIGVIKRIE